MGLSEPRDTGWLCACARSKARRASRTGAGLSPRSTTKPQDSHISARISTAMSMVPNR